MANICPHCKSTLPPNALFCGACGKQVTPVSSPEETATTSFAFPSVPPFPSVQNNIAPPAGAHTPYTAESILNDPPMHSYMPNENEPPTNAPISSAPSYRSSSTSAEDDSITTAQYFLMMMVGAIPVFGWFYLLLLALNAKAENKRHFAAGMLLFIPVFCLSVFLFVKAFLQGFF